MAEATGSQVTVSSGSDLRLPTGQGVEDMWTMIFEYLEDPLDLYRLMLASPQYFEPLLKDRKSLILFSLVLQVLDRRDYIPKATTLQCRSVCKWTKSVIDRWLLDCNPCFENVDGCDHDKLDPDHDRRHCWKINYMWEDQIQRYANCVRNGTFTPGISTPFLEGFLSVALSATDHLEEFHPNLLPDFRYLLANYGNQIRHFRFVDNHSGMNIFEFLREFLLQMPKLRSLQVCGNVDVPEFNPEGLPNLRDLRVLKIHAKSSRVFRILLTRYGSQVEMLECLSSIYLDQTVITLCPNLKQLAMPLFNNGQIWSVLSPRVNWPSSLDTLSILWRPTIRLQRNFEVLLVALNSCFKTSRTLRTLKIKLSTETGTSVPSSVRLSLQCLKRLHITLLDVRCIPIDFILGMSETLEEFILNIFWRRAPVYADLPLPPITEELPRERIQFMDHLERMYDSNVWELMPKLELITIRRGQYIREPHEPLPATYCYKRQRPRGK